MIHCGKCKSTVISLTIKDEYIRALCNSCGWDKYYIAQEEAITKEEKKNIKKRIKKTWYCAICKTPIRAEYRTKYCPKHKKEIRKKQLKDGMKSYKKRWGI